MDCQGIFICNSQEKLYTNSTKYERDPWYVTAYLGAFFIVFWAYVWSHLVSLLTRHSYREIFLIRRYYDYRDLFIFEKVYYTMIVTISWYEYSFCYLPFIKVRTHLEYHFSIDISFCFSFFTRQRGTKYDIIPYRLEIIIEITVLWYKPHKKDRPWYSELISEPGTKRSIVELPSALSNSETKIGSIDISNDILYRHSDWIIGKSGKNRENSYYFFFPFFMPMNIAVPCWISKTFSSFEPSGAVSFFFEFPWRSTM